MIWFLILLEWRKHFSRLLYLHGVPMLGRSNYTRTHSKTLVSLKNQRKDTDLSVELIKVGLEQFALRPKESIIVRNYKNTENRSW